jgi:ABC-type lipoprotein export system ATPase subunit
MNCFEIENLDCSYENGKQNPKIVLEIKQLSISKGKVVFIVGQSGCGKSTILETLGLMNNTIVASGKTKFTFNPSEKDEVDFCKVWQHKNKFISEIRRNYFSFIFQQTNLMKNFSIEENSLLPKLIKGGSKKYEDTLRNIGLEQILIENKTKPGELSGGQQQRLAFVRAILPDFKILFGDEPTGNLDPDNAENLIKIIDDEIHADSTKTAIIVSHSIELAEKYADVIIKIHKRVRVVDEQKQMNCESNISEEIYGEIDPESVFEKNEDKWLFMGKSISTNELHKRLKA